MNRFNLNSLSSSPFYGLANRNLTEKQAVEAAKHEA
jgi:hypothetical protein